MEATLQLNSVTTFLNGDFTDTSRLVEEYLYYAENVREFSKATLKSRRIYLNQFLRYLEENELGGISTLSNTDLDIHFVNMRRRLSTHSVNSSKRSIKGFLRWYSEYKGNSLAVKLTEIREKTPDGKNPDILSHEEILTVIKKIRNKQDKLIVSVMYETGMRIAEVADMKIEHLRGNTLDVIGKGRKHRITYISPKLTKELYAWFLQNGWLGGYVFRPLMHGDGISGYTNTDTIRQRIKGHFREIIGREMHPHQLRHAFALRLLKSGCDLRSIQKLLGHSKIETTMVYLDIDNDYLQKQHARSFSRSVYA